jgi:hypothetical protein
MKTRDRSRLLVTATAFLIGGCASPPPAAPPPSSFEASVTEPGTPGAMAIDVETTTAVVTDIDHETRELTLLQSDGSRVAFVCGPEIKNFDQIKIGDHVEATVSNQLDITLASGGRPSGEGTARSVAVATRGAKPGIVATTTAQVTGKIVNMDPTARTVTLELSNGTVARYPVRRDVDMSKAKFGDWVVMRNTAIRSLVVKTP